MSQIKLVDVHSHLYDNDLVHDLNTHLKKAYEANIRKIILVGEDLETSKQVLQLSKNNDMLQACIGVHPCSVSSKNQILEMCDFIQENQKHIVGIGEVGLDFSPYFVKETETMTTEQRKELQRWALSKFVELSLKLDLPLNVHSRSAGRPAIDLLKKCGAKKVLLHAFDGSKKVAMQGLQCGYYFSIPPSIVRGEQKQELVKVIPLSNLLLETDAPALGPVKMEKNVPENLVLSCKKIAEIKNISYEEVAKATTENAIKLFSKLNLS